MRTVWELSRQFLKDYSVSSGTRFLNCLAVQSLHSPRYLYGGGHVVKPLTPQRLQVLADRVPSTGRIMTRTPSAGGGPPRYSRQHRAVPQRRPPHTGGAARYPHLPHQRRLHRPPHLPAHPPPALHHRPRRPTVSGGAGYRLSHAINYVNQKYACLYIFRRASPSFM